MTKLLLALVMGGLCAATGTATAGPLVNLIQNSNFSASSGVSATYGYQPDYNGSLTDWSNSNAAGNGSGANNNDGYNFVFLGNNGNAGGVGAAGAVSLWTAMNGGSNSWNGNSLSGDNYIAADGAYQTGALTTTVSVTAGVQYLVSFQYAGAQQNGFSGATTEGWRVGLGDTVAASLTNSQTTAILNNSNHGFTGWFTGHFYFTADTTGNEILSFFALGTPNGEPPFTLLADPMMAIAEPASIAAFGFSLAVLVVIGRRRRDMAAL